MSIYQWLRWFFTSPLKRDFFHGGHKKYKGRENDIWRIRHPAFWVVFWELSWVSYKYKYNGRWLQWFVWAGGTFTETLLRGRFPQELMDE